MDWTVLHRAAFSGDLKRLRSAVEEGNVNPESRDSYGHTPLHLACEGGHLEVVRYLTVEKGCKLLYRDDDGATALQKAVEHERYAVSRFLILELHCSTAGPGSLGFVSLLQALKQGDGEFVKYLQDKGEHTSSSGQSPLHLACSDGDLELVKRLVEEYEFNVNALDSKFQTPLFLACKYGRLNVVRFLLSWPSCDVDYPDSTGKSPLHVACSMGNIEVARLLTERESCHLNEPDDKGRTPLHLAAEHGHSNLVHLFGVIKGCDPSLGDMHGHTALHYACKSSSLESVNILLNELLCDPNYAPLGRKPPITVAQSSDVIKALVRCGAQHDAAYQTYADQFNECFPLEPPGPLVRVFLVGNTAGGKSTLAAAIGSDRNRVLGRIIKVAVPAGPTPGVAPLVVEREGLGSVALYDLSGRSDYLPLHDVLLQNTAATAPSLFLLVVDLRERDDATDSALKHWTSFVKTHCRSTDQRSQCQVIVVGSHVDQVKAQAVQAKQALVVALAGTEVFAGLCYVAFVALDCRYAASARMTELRLQMKQTVDLLRPSTLLRFSAHCLLLYVQEKFGGVPAVALSDVLVAIKNTRVLSPAMHFFPDSALGLSRVLEHLNARGNLLVLTGPRGSEESWLVIDPAVILSSVLGTALTPSAPSNGLLPYSSLAGSQPEFRRDIVAQLLRHLEFCRRVSDPGAVKLLQGGSAASPCNESVFFFPGLVTAAEPDGIWKPDNYFDWECGWQLCCSQPEEFFTRRLCYTIQTTLLFTFALAPPLAEGEGEGVGPGERAGTGEEEVTGAGTREAAVTGAGVETDPRGSPARSCVVWKGGLKWTAGDGVEVAVRLSEKEVAVALRCPSDMRDACEALRSAVAAQVGEIQQKLSPHLSCKGTHIGACQ